MMADNCEFRITFKCEGSTYIVARDREEAKEKFYENYEPTIDDIWDMKIDEIELSREE